MSNSTPTPRSNEAPLDDEQEQSARVHVEQLLAFRTHAAVFGAGITIIFVVNLATNLSAGIANEWSAWWSVWSFIGWGLGVAVHGLVVRLNRPTPTTSVV